MTWKEFKESVEQKGVIDDDILDYIDVPCDGPLTVEVEDFGTYREFLVW